MRGSVGYFLEEVEQNSNKPIDAEKRGLVEETQESLF